MPKQEGKKYTKIRTQYVSLVEEGRPFTPEPWKGDHPTAAFFLVQSNHLTEGYDVTAYFLVEEPDVKEA